MDKKTIIGIVLIVIVTLLMPFYQKWINGDQEALQKQKQAVVDSAKITHPVQKPVAEQKVVQRSEPRVAEQKPVTSPADSSASKIVIEEAPEEKTIEIENDYLRVVFSSERGANPTRWELKPYQFHTGGNVNLIKDNFLEINFLNVDGKKVDLSKYNFFSDPNNESKIQFAENEDYKDIRFYLPLNSGKIVKTIRFYKNRYDIGLFLTFENLQNYVINRRYNIGWRNGLPPTEININDDNRYAKVFSYMADELEHVGASDKSYEQNDFNGRVDWVAVRTKYFLSAIIPGDPSHTNGATLGGIELKDSLNTRKIFDASIDETFDPSQTFTDSFTVYLGPLDYYILKKYDVNLQKLVMNKDWYERLFRPISLLIIPAFKFLYRFIPNYGLVILIFSILIKILLHPLTKKSYQSMSEMQFLQPKMTELREKYKNEPQRLNKEMMKLYKEHGVNPMGGCLPMLLQMPLLFSLFIVFRSTIQLRGKPFVLWMNDLSAPDVLHLGVNLPFLGDNIHVLPILMGVTMIWQSKMSITDPKQKMMSYFMPLFMIFIFYSLPSGLNLYYAVFNILSMLQTKQIKNKMHPGDEPKEIKEAPARKPKVQASKGRKKKS